MTMSKDLFVSMLSTGAYKLGIANPCATSVENVLPLPVPLPEGSELASFCALAYRLTQSVGTSGNQIADGTTIIACRGKDNAPAAPFHPPTHPA